MGGVPVHYIAFGDGVPVLVLHGAGVDHREMAAVFEPIFDGLPGYRRIYPDLPGMGRTPAPATLAGADDVLDLLLGFVDAMIGPAPFRLIGHSAGAYFAGALAGNRARQVAGLALVCPLGGSARDVPEHQVLVASVDPYSVLGTEEAASFGEYFVVQTHATLDRFLAAVAPSLGLADEAALERIARQWEFRSPAADSPAYSGPTLILAGRQDATVGYAGAWDLVKLYPRATFAVLDQAGHALPHEQPELLEALVTEWLARSASQTSVPHGA
ncbi:alpha/beta hydrolase fold protein [Pseudarthrobacter chlorophenolicus A6]|uniref:Alpha/beta hydrolase fold protein n=1 Tax=Pseudarthrobacter chlorophenolicus (strain ATCC 700700 / DSM 12829 / CIP 107037 / JCM 12360 / KCTC 9906 / NCIMB 13794 / A6) TaxID=452863 RepID=B8H8K0_PSECP|nr:alpha/beta hydrolase [Pseudarthrobacter chlorophenolicus]ACL39878.1 alpha/beta hydrolase fold protein [Pseudarthrobacter chlorophenolicus A6]SDQ92058.1 Pimeloyl-ACP methyl ester carboxylesterase [Pseudarthrobacter chlorophenolicus]